ncbi:hypothetical protein [Kibdelosporangium philippinense]|uniref:hypothetical protein n=1 Tax=Kibdelosporangium philippinense TaxID=211113 RepID=UPI00361A96D9
MKVTLTALNAPNLPLAPACRPHGAAARRRDRGHGGLRAVSPGERAGHLPEHRSGNARSASLKILAVAVNASHEQSRA